MIMKLRFKIAKIGDYSLAYTRAQKPRDRRFSEIIAGEVIPAYRSRGFLEKEEFLRVCEWKTPRSRSHCESNDASIIKDVSTLVLTTKSEELRIQLWTLLSGVKWPTASVFLHFAFENQYPILDFRALQSIGIKKPPAYTFTFWQKYVDFTREQAAKARVSMRELDQALWMYSKSHPM